MLKVLCFIPSLLRKVRQQMRMGRSSTKQWINAARKQWKRRRKISNSVYLLFDRQPKPMKKKELRCVVLSLLPPPLFRMPSIPIKKL